MSQNELRQSVCSKYEHHMPGYIYAILQLQMHRLKHQILMLASDQIWTLKANRTAALFAQQMHKQLDLPSKALLP